MSTHPVASIMTRDVFAVGADTSLETAARLLARHHFGGVPVIDTHGRPLGMLSQSDLTFPDHARSSRQGRPLYYRVAEGASRPVDDEHPPGLGVVADVMSPYVLSVGSSTPVADAARLMLADNVHRLLVVEDGLLVGLVSTMDVLRAVTR
jgi:CBS domain-containing protein